MPTTASAPRIFACGCAPTSTATPTNPIATPSSARPVTRWSWKNANASSALKIGTDAWMIDASPESIRVSPHERSQKGTAVFSRPTTASIGQCARRSDTVAETPSRSGTTTASVSAATPRRPETSVAGVKSRTAILMNMNELPQIRASSTSMVR